MKLPEPLLRVVFKDTEDGHFYSVDGKDMLYPGVTTILRILGKPALVPWAAKLAASSFRKRLDAFMKNGKSVELSEFDAWEKEAAKAPFAERDKAAEKGTDVHSHIDNFLTKGWQPVGVPSFDNFLKWYGESGLTFLAGDTPVVSENMAYGGRLDALFIDKNQRLILVDVKTGKGVYGEALIQMGGYAEALIETYGIKPLRMIVLHVRPEQTKVYEFNNPVFAIKAWRSVKTMYDDLQIINKMMEDQNESQRHG